MIKNQASQPQNIFKNTQKYMIQEIFQENQEISTGQNIQKQKTQIVQKKKIIKKTAKKDDQIKKPRKKRVFSKSCRFAEQDMKTFYLFPFYLATNYPFFKISWHSWKPNKYFIKMQEFFSKYGTNKLQNVKDMSQKTKEQCKSFDQRQKMIVHKDKDLFQAAYTHLKSSNLVNDQKQVISDYLSKMNQKSNYMKFLQTYNIDDEDGNQLPDKIHKQIQKIQVGDQQEITNTDYYSDPAFINEFFDAQQSNQHYFAEV